MIAAFCQTVSLPVLLIYYGTAVLLLLIPDNGTLVFLGLPYHPEEVSVSYTLLEKWLLIYTIPLLVNGFLLERFKQIELFRILRMKSETKLRVTCLTECMTAAWGWIMLLGFGSLFFLSMRDAIIVFLLISTNLLFWTAVQVFVFYLCGKQAWSGVIVICTLTGMILLGEYLPSCSFLLPSTWGMATRSILIEPAGMHPIYMILANVGSTVILILNLHALQVHRHA